MIRAALALAVCAAAVRADEAPNPARSSPPAARVSVQEALETGVQWLIEHQNKDGSFGTSASGRPWGLSCSVPGGHQAFRTASTALCYMGLLDAGVDVPGREETARKTLAFLTEHGLVKRASGRELYNVWSHGYSLRALAQALRQKAPGADPEAIRHKARELIKAIGVLQSTEGGFGYYDFNTKAYKPSWSTPFTTATVLIGLQEARAEGLEVPQKMIDDSVKNILLARKKDGSYLYGYYLRWRPVRGINQPKGSSLRTQACNMALYRAGHTVTKEDLRIGLGHLVQHHRFAVAGVGRPIPHESWYQVSGYFYLYGHQYAAMVLEQLDEADKERYWPKVVEFTLKCRRPDGSFWDYPVYGYHKAYGTGYALMTLARCPKPIAGKIDPAKQKPE